MNGVKGQGPKPDGVSLRARLLVGAVAWIVLALVLAGWGLRNLFKEHIEQQLQAQLVLHLNQLSAAVNAKADGSISVTPIAGDARFEKPLSGLFWQVDELRLDEHRQPVVAREALARSRSLWDQALALPKAAAAAQAGQSYRTLQLRDAGGNELLAVVRNLQLPENDAPPLRLAVAADRALLSEPLQRFTSMLTATLALLALGLVIAVLVQLQVVMRPLAQLRLRLAAVREGEARNLEGQFPREIQPLVDEFNKVLNTNADIVQRARTQAGNLAHAVNTPLSILGNAAAQESGPLAALVREQSDVARRQIEHHLARARAASAAHAGGLSTPVLAHLQALVRTMEKLHAERGIRFRIGEIDPMLAFRGEEQDFYELLGNLLDNAGKWARGEVSVTATAGDGDRDDGMLELLVDDDGPGMNEDQHAQAFQRGVRLDERRPGSGLGLDIVRELAQTYGGDIAAQRSPLGGLRMRLTLPATRTH